MAKSKMNERHREESTSASGSQKQNNEGIGYHPHQPLTKMHMGLFDLNSFHGLDELWERQQVWILQALIAVYIIFCVYTVFSHHTAPIAYHILIKKRQSVLAPSKIEVKKTSADADHTDHHHVKKPKFFWDLGK